jgi:cbb3-type cytochrome oxidase cytochrome c subunit
VKTGFSIFVAAFIALGLSWSGLVLGPVSQLGTQGQTNILNSSEIYPVQRTGEATLGLQVYRAYGCAACHTTQIGQDGVICDVVLSGTNPLAVKNMLASLKLTGLSKEEADAVSGQITAKGGKTETHVIPTGPDISRTGWGMRHSVAEDFLWDNPVQLGNVRVGPDLSNVGMRYPADWQFKHLYDPKSVVNTSTMPSFKFLFEKNGAPTEDAKNLVAYLLSLRADVPLHDAPFSTVAPVTAAGTKK